MTRERCWSVAIWRALGIRVSFHNLRNNSFIQISKLEIEFCKLSRAKLETRSRHNLVVCVHGCFILKQQLELLNGDETGDARAHSFCYLLTKPATRSGARAHRKREHDKRLSLPCKSSCHVAQEAFNMMCSLNYSLIISKEFHFLIKVNALDEGNWVRIEFPVSLQYAWNIIKLSAYLFTFHDVCKSEAELDWKSGENHIMLYAFRTATRT